MEGVYDTARVDRRMVGNIMEQAGEDDVIEVLIDNSIRERGVSKSMSCLQRVVKKRGGLEDKSQE